VSRTKEGNEADLYPRGGFFGLKNIKRYLVVERNKTETEVITDMQIISEDQTVPSGFSEIKRTLEKDDKCLQKEERLCVAKGSFHTSPKKVTEIAITSDENFARNHLYTVAGKVNGLYLCFKVEVTARLSDAKRASAADKKRAAPPPPAQPSPSRSCAPRLVSPLEGLQFSLHECVSNGDASSRQKFKKSNIALQNQDEIVSKYFYGFETEEKALRKIH